MPLPPSPPQQQRPTSNPSRVLSISFSPSLSLFYSVCCPFTNCSIDTIMTRQIPFHTLLIHRGRLESDAPPGNRAQLRNSIHIPPLRINHSLAHDASADGPEYYGTRLATVLLVRRDGRCLFIERDIWQLDSAGAPARGDPRQDRVFRFALSI